jgi:hypothetical protein
MPYLNNSNDQDFTQKDHYVTPVSKKEPVVEFFSSKNENLIDLGAKITPNAVSQKKNNSMHLSKRNIHSFDEPIAPF